MLFLEKTIEMFSTTPIELRTDAPELIEPLVKSLVAAGFPIPKLLPLNLPPRTALSARNCVKSGPLAEAEVAEVIILVSRFLETVPGIDCTRHPLERDTDLGEPELLSHASSRRRKLRRDPKTQDSAIITLPLKACRDGRLPSYAGAFSDRFEVLLLCDDREAGATLEHKLITRGYRVRRRTLDDPSRGFAISHPSKADHPAITELLRREMEIALTETCSSPESYTIGMLPTEEDGDVITAYAPFAAARAGTLQDALANPGRFKCKIFCQNARIAEPLCARLTTFGFRSLKVDHDIGEEPRISYGGATSALLEKVTRVIGETYGGLKLRLNKAWKITDNDLWIYLPDDLAVPEPKIDPPPCPAPVRHIHRRSERPFMEIDGAHLMVGPYRLARKIPEQAHVPNAQEFSHYTIDQSTAETLAHLAQSVIAREPVMLEGETATSKTSSIRYLAHRIGQRVDRIQMHGHSDSSELVGRMVVSENGGWKWKDLVLPQALRNGNWVILDEINTVESSSVAERCNSILEMPAPSLMLSEYDGEVIEGKSVHADFRIFATLNPAEGYSGRSNLSPAFRDRFLGYRYVPRPSENDFLNLLLFLITGKQPEVVFDGVAYPGSQGTPVFPALAQIPVPELFRLLESLARFHAGAEASAISAANSGSSPSADRPVITRRQLIATLQMMERNPGTTMREWGESTDRAIRRYYLGKAGNNTAWFAALETLLSANGIHPDLWGLA